MNLTNNEMAKRVLVEEVSYQASMALPHYELAESYLNNFETRQNRAVWAHIQAFLMHAGVISKLAHPPRQAAQRGDLVRRLLEIEEASPIFDRNGRNNVEHLDERLDLWLSDTSRPLLEIVLANEAGLEFLTAERPLASQPRIRRVLLLDSMTFISEGRHGPERTDLKALKEEVVRIGKLASSLLDQMDNNPQRRVFVVQPGIGVVGSKPTFDQE